MRIVYHQELRPRVVKVSHEFGLAGAPTSSELQPQCREQLVAQRLLIFIVFRSRHGQNHRGACRLDHLSNAHGLARTRISNDDMPAPLVQGRTQHRLETALKGRFAVMWTLETPESMCP